MRNHYPPTSAGVRRARSRSRSPTRPFIGRQAYHAPPPHHPHNQPQQHQHPHHQHHRSQYHQPHGSDGGGGGYAAAPYQLQQSRYNAGGGIPSSWQQRGGVPMSFGAFTHAAPQLLHAPPPSSFYTTPQPMQPRPRGIGGKPQRPPPSLPTSIAYTEASTGIRFLINEKGKEARALREVLRKLSGGKKDSFTLKLDGKSSDGGTVHLQCPASCFPAAQAAVESALGGGGRTFTRGSTLTAGSSNGSESGATESKTGGTGGNGSATSGSATDGTTCVGSTGSTGGKSGEGDRGGKGRPISENPFVVNKLLTSAGHAKGVLRIVEQHVGHFNHVNFATALHRLAKFSKNDSSRRSGGGGGGGGVGGGGVRGSNSSGGSSGSSGSSSGLTAARNNIREHRSFEDLVGPSVLERGWLDKCRAQEITNVVWALTVLEHRPSRALMLALLAACRQRLASEPRSFRPQNIANICLAVAKLSSDGVGRGGGRGGGESGKLDKLSGGGGGCGGGGGGSGSDSGDGSLDNTQASSNITRTAMSVSSQEVSTPEKHTHLRAESDDYEDDELSTLRKELLAALTDAASCTLSSFNPQDLSNFAYALARLDYDQTPSQDQDLLGQLAREAAGKMRSFKPQNLVNLAVSLRVVRAWLD